MQPRSSAKRAVSSSAKAAVATVLRFGRFGRFKMDGSSLQVCGIGVWLKPKLKLLRKVVLVGRLAAG